MKYFIPLIMLFLLIGCGKSDESTKNEATIDINTPVKNEETNKNEEIMTAVNQLTEMNNLWNYQDPAGTEKKFRELLPKAIESGNVDYLAQLLTQIARTLGLQGKFEEAHKILDEVKPLLTDDLKHAKLRYLLERGRVFNSSGKQDEAKKLFLEAYNYGTENNIDYYTFDAIHMLGIAGSKEEQIKWNLKALELIDKTTIEKLKQWEGPVCNNLAWSYHESKDYENALKYFEKSLAYWENSGSPQGIFSGKWALARCYRSLNRTDEALEIQLALEKEMNAEGGNPFGYVYDELGELYLLKENEPEAIKYFKLAYDMLIEAKEDGWLQQNEPEHWNRIKEFAEKAK